VAPARLPYAGADCTTRRGRINRRRRPILVL